MSIPAQDSDSRICVVDCGKDAPECSCRARYPYTHHGPTVHGSKIADYLISEVSLREDSPELFEVNEKEGKG